MNEQLLERFGNVLAFHDNALLARRFAERSGRPVDDVTRLFSELSEPVNRGWLDGDGLRAVIGERLGLTLSADELFALWNCHFTIHDAVMPLVESLVGRVKLLLLSNTNVLHARFLLPKLPVLRRFDHLLLSHALALVKPEEAIYREALRRAGTAPEATAFFDDIAEYVEAARTLGIRGFVFKDAQTFRAQLAQLGLE